MIFSGLNSSQMYLQILRQLYDHGEECAPRGKKIKEIRPAVLEFMDPRSRVTFLKGRVINPFFQLAESFWILSGRADVKWLSTYNSNIASFSDDGVYFNAPYGERLRYWSRNSSIGRYPNRYPNYTDQLVDVYSKIKADPDTRQAVASIFNPAFDNAHYTIDLKGKDMPCNLLLMFKLRNGQLDMTVCNRSNDLHWGTFGANLAQFSTILEVMASWLEVEMGTYRVFTDSLHIYLGDYGAKETYNIHRNYPEFKGPTPQFNFIGEPRFTSTIDEFDNQVKDYWDNIDGWLHSGIDWDILLTHTIGAVKDPYLRMTFLAMAAYVHHKLSNKAPMYTALYMMPDSSWKVSCLRFLFKKYKDDANFTNIYKHYDPEAIDYINRTGEV